MLPLFCSPPLLLLPHDLLHDVLLLSHINAANVNQLLGTGDRAICPCSACWLFLLPSRCWAQPSRGLLPAALLLLRWLRLLPLLFCSQACWGCCSRRRQCLLLELLLLLLVHLVGWQHLWVHWAMLPMTLPLPLHLLLALLLGQCSEEPRYWSCCCGCCG